MLLRRLITYVVLGLLFAAPGEVLNQILARHDPHAFRTTMISYSVLLVVGFHVARFLRRVLADRRKAAMTFYFLFGTLGLLVEWLLLGNGPVLDVFQVVVQPGMFTFWGTLMLGPLMVMEPAGPPGLRRSFLAYFAAFSATYLLIAALVPRDRGGIFFGFVLFAAGTAALNLFHVSYFRGLSGTASGPAVQ